MTGEAPGQAPRGLRLYVIGDVHGLADRLGEVHGWIDADLAARPAPDWRVVHLGDYIDRGPDSAGVIARLVARIRDRRTYCLRGNHEQYLVDFAGDAGSPGLGDWLRYGGTQTLGSYGIGGGAAPGELRAAMLAAIPPAQLRFLAGLPHMLRLGGYVFVHAGIRPGVALDAQAPQDLIWIREPFLSSRAEHGAVVVHGHTPAKSVEDHGNRINIDTGAVFGGPLSCLVLEGASRALLTPDGPTPLSAG